MPTYPSKPIVFLIADSIINQPGGKMSIIGAFAAGQMLVPPGTKFPVSLPLAVYAVFDDGEGAFHSRLRITSEDGKQLLEVDGGPADKKAGQPFQLALVFNLLPFPSAGNYTFDIFLDDHVYTNKISIRVSDKPIT